jgi:hypothetical protein
VDSFPKNQRFIFGQRLAGHALDIMEILVEAAYARDKAVLLHTGSATSPGVNRSFAVPPAAPGIRRRVCLSPFHAGA